MTFRPESLKEKSEISSRFEALRILVPSEQQSRQIALQNGFLALDPQSAALAQSQNWGNIGDLLVLANALLASLTLSNKKNK